LTLRAAVFAVAVAGCYAPHVENGALPCAMPEKACPQGFYCANDDHCYRVGVAPDLSPIIDLAVPNDLVRGDRAPLPDGAAVDAPIDSNPDLTHPPDLALPTG
jgi:hypothetical protein